MRAVGIVSCLAMALLAPAYAAEPTIAVPVAGCPGDGQLGPVAAETGRATLTVPAPTGASLAYYVFQDLGVLAPRGWHCFGLYGSNGTSLLVTPERHRSSEFFRDNPGLTGAAVQLSLSHGDTSGRFQVARVAARVFPVAQKFVQRVVAEAKRLRGRGFDANKEFPPGPYPDDTLTRRSDTEVEFETPANRDGLGTASLLKKNADPIAGVAILVPEEMDLVHASVRLPPELRGLAPAIIATVERTLGRRADDHHDKGAPGRRP